MSPKENGDVVWYEWTLDDNIYRNSAPSLENELKDKKIYPLHYEIYLPLLTPP